MLKMENFLAVDENVELANRMEIFDKLNNAIDNYENMLALYGANNNETRECLFRGVRNAFLLGKMYAYNDRYEKERS